MKRFLTRMQLFEEFATLEDFEAIFGRNGKQMRRLFNARGRSVTRFEQDLGRRRSDNLIEYIRKYGATKNERSDINRKAGL